MTQTFPKSQRLRGKTTIEAVATSGKTVQLPPFRCQYKAMPYPLAAPLQVAFAVPKKLKPRAVDRNKIRRRLREAYRKNKHELLSWCTQNNKHIGLLWIYNTKDVLDYVTIEQKTIQMLQKLKTSLEQSATEMPTPTLPSTPNNG